MELPGAAFGFFHDFLVTPSYYIFLESPSEPAGCQRPHVGLPACCAACVWAPGRWWEVGSASGHVNSHRGPHEKGPIVAFSRRRAQRVLAAPSRLEHASPILPSRPPSRAPNPVLQCPWICGRWPPSTCLARREGEGAWCQQAAHSEAQRELRPGGRALARALDVGSYRRHVLLPSLQACIAECIVWDEQKKTRVHLIPRPGAGGAPWAGLAGRGSDEARCLCRDQAAGGAQCSRDRRVRGALLAGHNPIWMWIRRLLFLPCSARRAAGRHRHRPLLLLPPRQRL